MTVYAYNPLFLPHQGRHPKVGQHNDSQHDPVISEKLEIIIFNITHEEFNGVHRHHKGYQHAEEQVEHLGTGEGISLQKIFHDL